MVAGAVSRLLPRGKGGGACSASGRAPLGGGLARAGLVDIGGMFGVCCELESVYALNGSWAYVRWSPSARSLAGGYRAPGMRHF